MSPTTEDSRVGLRVRAARRSEGLSLRALARSLGVSAGTLSQLETGKTRMTVVRLGQIAETLGRTVDDILSVPPSSPGEGPGEGPAEVVDGHWRHVEPLRLDPVLRAAVTVFLRTGYHGASVRDIAGVSGLSVSGIYHYHPSKQAMLRCILDLGTDDLLRRCRAAVADGADEVERFCLLVEAMTLFHTHRCDVGFLAATEARSLEPAARGDLAGRRREQQRMVDTEVTAGVASDRFATPHPSEASRAVVTMCTAVAAWYRPDGPCRPGEIAERYVRFALGVVAHRGA